MQLYIYMWIQNQRHTIIKTSEDIFKNIPLTLFERLHVRGSWRPNKTTTY